MYLKDVVNPNVVSALEERINKIEIDGIAAAWMRPEIGHDRRHAILYCHGGGYTSGNLGYARTLSAKLANTTGYEVLAFDYRLAPEHPYPAALEDALAAWGHLLSLGYALKDTFSGLSLIVCVCVCPVTPLEKSLLLNANFHYSF